MTQPQPRQPSRPEPVGDGPTRSTPPPSSPGTGPDRLHDALADLVAAAEAVGAVMVEDRSVAVEVITGESGEAVALAVDTGAEGSWTARVPARQLTLYQAAEVVLDLLLDQVIAGSPRTRNGWLRQVCEQFQPDLWIVPVDGSWLIDGERPAPSNETALCQRCGWENVLHDIPRAVIIEHPDGSGYGLRDQTGVVYLPEVAQHWDEFDAMAWWAARHGQRTSW